MKASVIFFALFAVLIVKGFGSRPEIQFEEKINNLVREYLSNPENAGLSIAIIKEDNEKIYCYGEKNKVTGQKIDAVSIFEIGSITKLFTSLILAEEIRKGAVCPDETLSECFPSDIISKDCSGINLLQLATHSSGLPRLADNFWPSVKDKNNPYIDYSARELYNYLSVAKPVFITGTRYNYSNIGAGLLGFILCNKNSSSYEDLVYKYICIPFSMPNTCVRLKNDQIHNLAAGHSKGKVVKNWDFLDPTAGQGALRSNIEDMLKFMKHNLYPEQSVLSDAIRYSQQVHFKDIFSGMQTGLGWHIGYLHGEKYLEHTGGTGGYRSFIGICPGSKTGVVILSNSDNSVTALGTEILKELKRTPL